MMPRIDAQSERAMARDVPDAAAEGACGSQPDWSSPGGLAPDGLPPAGVREPSALQTSSWRMGPGDHRRTWPRGWGLLVVGHGTADRVGAAESVAVAHRVASRLVGVPVELGFLEVIEPAIGRAVDRLAARGCRQIVAAPLLLFRAGHARRDVPEALAAAAQASAVSVVQADPLGVHPAIVALSRLRRRAALLGRPAVAPAETALVMVGRGASDPTSASQLEAFTDRTLGDVDARPAHVGQGFVAVAKPRLADALAAAAVITRVRRVIVQPHLLFRGHVEREVIAAVDRARLEWPEMEWVVVDRLGAVESVAEAIVDRAWEAWRGPARV